MAYKVFLSAGHGGKDPGATGYGLQEKNVNLNTLLGCRNELLRHGVIVVASRLTDENDSVEQEVREANAAGAILAVSFHANSDAKRKGNGFEAYYYKSDANGKRLAQLGEKHIKALGQNSRGIKSGNHLYFIKNTKMTAVLFESFFISNDTDNDIGDTVAEQEALGVAYAKAILEYFGMPYKAPENPVAKPKVFYFKQYTGESNSIVDALKSLGIMSTLKYRTQIAKANGIKSYIGLSKQNSTLLSLLKKGKLIKP